MASLGAPGGCAQQGHERQAEAGHCVEWGQALGSLARSFQGFQSSSGGWAWRGVVQDMCKRVVEFLYSQNTTMGGVALCLCYLEYFSGFESLFFWFVLGFLFLFLVAVNEKSINI